MDKKPQEKNFISKIIEQYKDNRMARILFATILLVLWIVLLEFYK